MSSFASPDRIEVQGDVVRRIEWQIFDDYGPVDLSGATRAILRVRKANADPSATIVYDAVISDPAKGQITFTWPDGSTEETGDFWLQFAVYWGDRADSYPKPPKPYLLLRRSPRI